MYFLVKLIESKEKIVIPSQWIKDLDMCAVYNYGVTYQKNKVFTVFVTGDEKSEPDFQLAIRSHLKLTHPACYQAKLLKCFGNIFTFVVNLFVLIDFEFRSTDKSQNLLHQEHNMNDSDVDEIQSLLQSSDSDIGFYSSDEEMPRPKKNMN